VKPTLTKFLAGLYVGGLATLLAEARYLKQASRSNCRSLAARSPGDPSRRQNLSSHSCLSSSQQMQIAQKTSVWSLCRYLGDASRSTTGPLIAFFLARPTVCDTFAQRGPNRPAVGLALP